MAIWKTLTDEALDERTIYIGAYGFRDCDALGRVWGRTPKAFLRALSAAYAEEGRRYASEDETETQVKAQLWNVGPFPETVGEVVAALECEGDADEFRDSVRESAIGCA